MIIVDKKLKLLRQHYNDNFGATFSGSSFFIIQTNYRKFAKYMGLQGKLLKLAKLHQNSGKAEKNCEINGKWEGEV